MPALSSGIVRIAVVGDEGTGKTSLISTAANDTFDQRPPPVLPPTRLPPEFSSDHTPMLITDTSSRPEDVPVADIAIQQSDVVVVCFDSRRNSTLDSIRSIWYPRIQQLKPNIPVIIACCKADRLTEERETAQLRERVEIAVHDLQHVEVCLNCSARTLRMVSDIFFFALKSVLYPLHPLYDRLEKRLRPLCAKALKRAFIICDADKDGALSDQELNNFQIVCFNAALTEDELQNVKQMVLTRMPNGVCDRGLTLEGFLFLHVLFIERGRLESTWAVLRKFGYNDDLRLNDDVLDRINWSLPSDQVYELSQVALDFLGCQFSMYDEDADGLLSWQQLESMFSTIPPPVWNGEQWSRLLVPGTFGAAHRLDAFLLKWRFSAMYDPRAALAHLLYLGYGGPGGSGAQALLAKSFRRRSDKRSDIAARSTLVCYVFGPHGAGKSAILRALAIQAEQGLAGGQVGSTAPTPVTSQGAGSTISPRTNSGTNMASPYTRLSGGGPGNAPLMAVGSVPCDEGRERALIMLEVPSEAMSGLLSSYARAQQAEPPTAAASALSILTNTPIYPALHVPPEGNLPDLSRCDVAAFVFDSRNPSSFQAAAEMMAAVSTAAGESLPCLLVGAKDDLGMAPALDKEVSQVCSDLEIPRPIPVSVESGEMGGLFKKLVGAALSPETNVPNTPARKATKLAKRKVLLGAAAVGAGILATFAIIKIATSDSNSSSSNSGGSSSSSGNSSSSATSVSSSTAPKSLPSSSAASMQSSVASHGPKAAAAAVSSSQQIVESLSKSVPEAAASASKLAGAVSSSFGSYFKGASSVVEPHLFNPMLAFSYTATLFQQLLWSW